MISFDIFLTVLLNITFMHQQLNKTKLHQTNQVKPISSQESKLIHLNFQNMELTSVQHNSRQLFERSDKRYFCAAT